MTIKQQLISRQATVDQVIQQQLAALPQDAPRLRDAMHHAALLGGKRIRPFLVYETGRMLGATDQQLAPAAAAIEYVHAYSLTHDDLPAMDNDALRRGQPTCHVAFDEATAILAGDALQTLAFEVLSQADQLSAECRIALIQQLSRASGYLGMCGGQAMDIAATDQQISLPQLKAIHSAKTGALIRAAVRMGAIIGNASAEVTGKLDNYAKAIGLAFQVQDDILDVTSDTKTLGKPQGSDSELNKSTYPVLLGLEGAQQHASSLLDEALHALQGLPYNSDNLAEFARFVVQRSR
ncbi:(2E,6E)-farnesyl diphosphate synthase [Corallincola spongiicola]|uniref:(2E,6E)-farnesyl diphosphate synthase n=1 Tax=Corallincola spongiicola TaxID=2520508 RepID=UPI003CCC74D5